YSRPREVLSGLPPAPRERFGSRPQNRYSRIVLADDNKAPDSISTEREQPMAIILSAVDRNRVGDKSGTLLQMASAFSRSGLSVLLIGDEPHAWASSIPGLALLRGSRDL